MVNDSTLSAKEYLRQYLNTEREINAKLDEIRHLRDLATKTTQVLTPDRVQSSAENKTERIVAKIADLGAEVNNEIDELQQIRHHVEAVILSVQNIRLREVLRCRYIKGQRWEAIAVELNYTYRNVCYLHGKALKEIAKKIS